MKVIAYDVSLCSVGAGCVELGDVLVYSGASGWVATAAGKLHLDLGNLIGALVGVDPTTYNYVAVVEILPELLGGHGKLPHMNEFMLLDLLKFHKVATYTGAAVTDTAAGTVTIRQGEETKTLPAATLISAVGYQSDDGLYQSLKDLDIPVYNIGDSKQVHNIMHAIWNAYELARDL